jgi:hypothetical protein
MYIEIRALAPHVFDSFYTAAYYLHTGVDESAGLLRWSATLAGLARQHSALHKVYTVLMLQHA